MAPMHDAADPYATPSCAIPARRDAAAEIPAPKRPRGRPRRFDADKQRRLCLLVSVGLSRRAAARHVGVPPSSVVYAAGRDPAFAALLHAAEHARANRPPELADIGRRAWRAQRRLLQSHNVNGTRPPNTLFFHPEFRRTVRILVRKYFRKCLAELSIFENSIDLPFPQTDHSQQLPASHFSTNHD